MASQKSRVAAQLVQELALRLNVRQTCPLTPVHIPDVENALTDIPSRSFGIVREWECKSDMDFLTLFNTKFPLPQQASWTVFRFGSKVITHVISALRMKGIMLAKWQRLPRIGKHTGQIGQNMSSLWDWTLLYRGLNTQPGCMVRALTGFATRVRQGLYDDWNGRWRYHGHRTGGDIGVRTKPNKSQRLWGAKNSSHGLPKCSTDGARRTHQRQSNSPSRSRNAKPLDQAIGDLTLNAFYYL